MAGLVVLGAQWGDEGKGKITDYLAHKAEVVVRYQGGNNAGHTVEVEDKKYKLHLIPSGIIQEGKPCIIGNGVVVDPAALVQELEYLKDEGVDVSDLRISERAHLIMPYHRILDELSEERLGEKKIGTTKKGIGPCYMDKVSRVGIRVCDLYHPDAFRDQLQTILADKNEILEKVYNSESLDFEMMYNSYLEYAEYMKPYVCNAIALLHDMIRDGKKVLFEGAQGTFLDIDYGTYPFVTSSHPITGGVTTGSGASYRDITEALGVVKAYTTRVGEGPFPTELIDETGEYLRQKGFEFGTTTGRARRCGWYDGVMLRYSAQINGLTGLAITKIDTLAGLDKVKMCVAYKRPDGTVTQEFPANLAELATYEPVYEEFEGWSDDIANARSYEELPETARVYLERIAEISGVKIDIVSVGPKRSETIIVKDVFTS
jgi:adenylosuccinate synthase